jgi:hypothetical protein
VYQKDYILRMIAMLMKFLGEVLGLIKKGDLKKASDQLEDGYNIFLREDSSFFRNIPEEKLTQNLLQKHNYTNGHMEILAELFNAEAELNMAKGDKSATLEFSRKALILFKFVDTEQKTYSAERLDKMEVLRKRIEELNFSA